MHTNIVTHVQYSCRHFKNILDFEIGVVVHTMHTNHDSRCNVLLFQFTPQTYSDAMKYIHGCKFFKVYQNLVTTSPFFVFFTYFFNHVKIHLWMIMMDSKIVITQNIVLLKFLTTFDSLFFMGIKI
jgi:hypothetical protein